MLRRMPRLRQLPTPLCAAATTALFMPMSHLFLVRARAERGGSARARPSRGVRAPQGPYQRCGLFEGIRALQPRLEWAAAAAGGER